VIKAKNATTASTTNNSIREKPCLRFMSTVS
jgi:hypothetical protein